MAVITAQHVLATRGGIENSNLSVALDSHSATVIPYASEAAPWLGNALPSGAYPVLANGSVIAAQKAGAWVDDWYHRVHISPQRVDLGNVVSAQTTPVYLWNAWLGPRTLLEIEGLGDGIEVLGQPTPPLVFPGLKELTWELRVTPDGQPVLDTVLQWVFDTGHAAQLRVTATRIIPWSFVPDWGDAIRERLTAATDVMQSESGVSQRRQLRLAPRREFSAAMYVEGRERQLLDLALFGWGARVWAMPIWPDMQLLQTPITAGDDWITCSTAVLDFRAGGLALLRGESAFTYEALEVDQVEAGGLRLKRPAQQSWPAGARLYPARPAQLLEQPALVKLTDQLVSAEVRFLVLDPCEWPEQMPTRTYRERPVWDRLPDESEDLTHAAERLLLTLDSGMAIPMVTDTAGRSFTVLAQRWIDQGRMERAGLRSFIYAMRGRQQVVWVPTHMDDLTIVAPVSALANTIDVAAIGYARFSGGRPGRRDIHITLTNGTVLMRRITGAVELSADVERLGLDAALGVDVDPGQIMRVSWMVLCRFSDDTQELEHVTDSEGVATWATVFREERDDEF